MGARIAKLVGEPFDGSITQIEFAMLGKILSDMYSRMPVIRDLLQISKSVQQAESICNDIRNIALAIEGRAREIRAAAHNLNTANTIRLLDFELAANPRYADRQRLLRYAFQVCSQNGEDGMIHEIFRRVGVGDRLFAEVGISDGTENNTAFLLTQGWKGFWIDSDETFVKVVNARPDLQGGCIKYLVSFVSKENIGELFHQLGVPKEFDLLSLDIDQNTYYAWEGLRKFRPRVVVVEYNALIPQEVDWKVHYDGSRAWDGTSNFGASLKAFELLGRELGYSLVGCDLIGVNAFFVRSDLVADKFAEPFTTDNHYEPPRYALSHRRGHRTAILDRVIAD